MKRTIHVKPAAPQYSVITNITFAQTDAWFGHTTQDLRMDLIYPEDTAGVSTIAIRKIRHTIIPVLSGSVAVHG